ncbi:3-oxoacyl-ACP reductase FabG [Candidatus Bipolaricaulota bacterium]|nr:3-oxoacyl-ACP reductase FabG [Candidatus Bipolaricaulota bacterium]
MNEKNCGAVVTGSARGIGAATARLLAARGYGVCINYVADETAATAAVQQIVAAGGRAFPVRADVSDPDQARRLVEETADRFGGIRVVVNNAGVSQHRAFAEMSPQDWDFVVRVNLSSAAYVSMAAVRYLLEQPFGRIVNICSLRAMTGSGHGAHYAAGKSGLIGLTKSLALELAPDITVNAVSPGYTNTDMNAASLASKGDAIRASIPVHRVAEPDEIALIVGFLVSESAGYITGETINVNGGVYMR